MISWVSDESATVGQWIWLRKEHQTELMISNVGKDRFFPSSRCPVISLILLMVSRVAIVTCGGCMLLLLPGSSIDNIHSMMNTLVSYMHHT